MFDPQKWRLNLKGCVCNCKRCSLRSPTATQPRFLLSPRVILCLCPPLSLADVIKLNECLGFSAQKEKRGKSLLRPTATKPFPRPRPRLFVYVCSTVRTLEEALPVDVVCCRRWGPARCLWRTLVSTASIHVHQTMNEQLKNQDKATDNCSNCCDDFMNESLRRLLCVSAVNSMSCYTFLVFTQHRRLALFAHESFCHQGKLGQSDLVPSCLSLTRCIFGRNRCVLLVE